MYLPAEVPIVLSGRKVGPWMHTNTLARTFALLAQHMQLLTTSRMSPTLPLSTPNDPELDELYGPLEVALDESDRDLKRLRTKAPLPKASPSSSIQVTSSLRVLQLIRKAQSSHVLRSMSRNYTTMDPISMFYAIAIALSHPSYCSDQRLLESRRWEESQGEKVRQKGEVYTDEEVAALRIFRTMKSDDQERVRQEIIRVGMAKNVAVQKAAADNIAAEKAKLDPKKKKNWNKRQRQSAKRDLEEVERHDEKQKDITEAGTQELSRWG
jgi:hypothetical protein